MGNTEDILKSFSIQDSLNTSIWEKKGGEYKMKSEIRKRLLEIASEFIDFIDVDVFIDDIIMTGSLSNYNWSKYSDVDLHLVVDYKQYSSDVVELYKQLFELKKMLFNDKHDIKIKQYDVELYAQDLEQTVKESGAAYSLFFDEWIVKPKKEKVSINKQSIQTKLKSWMNMIDTVIKNATEEDFQVAKNLIKKYKKKLKNYRQTGLDSKGEFSVENLVFKALRRNGYIKKLYDFENNLVDKNLSLAERKRI